MPGGYFFKALSQWSDYHSRARRAEFWNFVVVAWLIEVFAVALTATMVNSAVDSDTMTIDTNADHHARLGLCVGHGGAVAVLLVPNPCRDRAPHA